MTASQISNTILLVEDSDDDVFVFKRALKKAELDNPLQLATDGQQAMDMLATSGDPAKRVESPAPFLIFLDLKLPYRNGFDVLEWMRAQPHLNRTITVILTGSEEPRDRQRAHALGVENFLVKPVTSAVLLDVVNSLRHRWSTMGVDPVALIGNSR